MKNDFNAENSLTAFVGCNRFFLSGFRILSRWKMKIKSKQQTETSRNNTTLQNNADKFNRYLRLLMRTQTKHNRILCAYYFYLTWTIRIHQKQWLQRDSVFIEAKFGETMERKLNKWEATAQTQDTQIWVCYVLLLLSDATVQHWMLKVN